MPADFDVSLPILLQCLALLELIEDRHNRGSMMVTSQIPVSKWYEIIGEKTIADAILDRLIHQSHRIELMGESMRKKSLRNNEKIKSNGTPKAVLQV